MASEFDFMRLALQLAHRGFGDTSPNPMVGAVIVKRGQIVGRGWHHRAGQPHAEIEALSDARRRGHDVKGASLYVTLEPCCTHGRTPPCTDAIIAAGIRRVVVGAVDPNPLHAGRGLILLRHAGIFVKQGLLARECETLNEAFNFWIQRSRPFVTVKAAMTLDGKIATPSGKSKWITGEPARKFTMRLRQGVDAVLVGINTVLADDPRLTIRVEKRSITNNKALRRIVLDSQARTPLTARVLNDRFANLTTIVVCKQAPQTRQKALARKARVLVAPGRNGLLDLKWLLKKLAAENVTSLLVEGGGEVNASFLLGRLAQRVAFFYAPLVLGGANARKAVGGRGVSSLKQSIQLRDVEWRRLGADWLMTARVPTENSH